MINKRPYPKYDEDFYGWTQATALLLREGRFHEVDMEHVIEEIEEMGISNEHQLTNRLAVLIAHLLKWQLQSDFRCRNWEGTIDEERKRIKKLIAKNPSLQPLTNEALGDGYDYSLSIILKLLPKACPYSFEQCMDATFFPSAS